MTEYFITPNTAPRMVRSDKYKKRPEVLRYFAFREEVQLRNVKVPDCAKIIFNMPIPDSWSHKKCALMLGQPHTQRPDLDNLIKALLDAVHENDSHIWKIHAEKRWSEVGSIVVEELIS